VTADKLTQEISGVIAAVLGRDDIAPDDDFFDLGANSLTIVNMQIQLEVRIGRTAPTSALMKSPSMRGWIGVYGAARGAPEMPDRAPADQLQSA
jgi:D-alanine--poly(phosphoribitol) ligase subunit 2